VRYWLGVGAQPTDRVARLLDKAGVKERANPALLNAKRKIRVANGSGTQVQDVNKLLKMHLEMSKAMKQIKKMGGLKGLAAMFGKGGLDAAMPGLGGAGLGPSAGGFPGLGGAGGADLSKFLKR